MSSQFHFANLSPDLLLDALDSVNVRADSGLLALNSYENRVYQFLAEDGQRYVVKFYRPERWTDAQIQEEHDFTHTLLSNDISVAAPISLNDQTLHHYQHCRFALFPSLGGRSFEVDNLDQLEQVGHSLGRIHSIGQNPPFSARPTLGLEEYLFQPRQILEQCPLIPQTLRQRFFEQLDLVIQEVAQLWQSISWQPLRLHGDCHPSNILWRDGPLFVDFDDARNGPAIQDFWLLLSGDHNEQRIQLDTLLEAYEEFHSFNVKELALIEPLRALRMVHYMAWLAKRWDDPAFPRAFPWFADAQYWEGQLIALQEQLMTLRQPPLTLQPQW